MIYLASPYSHPDAAGREQRFHAVCRMAAALMQQGHVVFAPIVHGHPLVGHGLPTDWPFWERFDREHLRWCDELVVLRLDGWRMLGADTLLLDGCWGQTLGADTLLLDVPSAVSEVDRRLQSEQDAVGGNPGTRAQDQMQVVGHHRVELDVDGKEPGHLFLADENPIAAMRVILAGHRILAKEKSTAHTAGPTIERPH